MVCPHTAGEVASSSKPSITSSIYTPSIGLPLESLGDSLR
jgi:hypothetical protein